MQASKVNTQAAMRYFVRDMDRCRALEEVNGLRGYDWLVKFIDRFGV